MSFGIVERGFIGLACILGIATVDIFAGTLLGTKVPQSEICRVVDKVGLPGAQCRAFKHIVRISSANIRADDSVYCDWENNASWFFEIKMRRIPGSEVCKRIIYVNASRVRN